jgi:hypothetical protein
MVFLLNRSNTSCTVCHGGTCKSLRPALSFEPIHRLVLNTEADGFWRDIGFEPHSVSNIEIVQPALDSWLLNTPKQFWNNTREEDCRLGTKKQRYPDHLSAF